MSREPTAFEFEVTSTHDGERLDRFLSDTISDKSRSQLKKHIELGAVLIGDATPTRGAKTTVRTGDVVRYLEPPATPSDLIPEDLPLDIVLEDEHIIVVNKAAGMVVHPAIGHPTGTLVNALLFHVQGLENATGAERPGIVHRLDKGTTGLMIVAKTEQAHSALVDAFRDRHVRKEYLGITMGIPSPLKGSFDTMHGRHPTQRLRFTTRVQDGKRALTHYEVLETFVGSALVRARIETGRTHQIRVHFCESGTPLAGDDLYGSRRMKNLKDERIRAPIQALRRTALHAERLVLSHPITQEKLDLRCPLPDDLATLLEQLAIASEKTWERTL